MNKQVLHTWEAVEVDSPKEGKELNTMLWEFGEVLVDHFKSAFENVLHDCWDLVLHKSLYQQSVRQIKS
jgi:hypothetical protein